MTIKEGMIESSTLKKARMLRPHGAVGRLLDALLGPGVVEDLAEPEAMAPLGFHRVDAQLLAALVDDHVDDLQLALAGVVLAWLGGGFR